MCYFDHCQPSHSDVAQPDHEEVMVRSKPVGVQVFFFFVLSTEGKTAAKPQPLPPAEQGAECTHQPVWKSTFSRILPEGVT